MLYLLHLVALITCCDTQYHLMIKSENHANGLGDCLIQDWNKSFFKRLQTVCYLKDTRGSERYSTDRHLCLHSNWDVSEHHLVRLWRHKHCIWVIPHMLLAQCSSWRQSTSAINHDESYSPYCMDHFKVTIAAKYSEMCSFIRRDFDQLDGYYYSWSQLLSAVFGQRDRYEEYTHSPHTVTWFNFIIAMHASSLLLPWPSRKNSLYKLCCCLGKPSEANCVSTLQWNVSDQRTASEYLTRHRSFSTLVTNTECTVHTHSHVVPVRDAFTSIASYTHERISLCVKS